MSTTETPAPATQQRPSVERITYNNTVYAKVYHLSSPQRIAEFGTQFGSLNTQFRRIQSLEQRAQIALTTAEKDALAKVREQEIRDFNGKDSLFQKVFGFAVAPHASRPHLVLNYAIRILTPVTDEEISKAREGKEFNEADVVVRDSTKFMVASTIGLPAIQEFERNVKIIQASAEAIAFNKATLPQLKEEDRAKQEAAIAAAEAKHKADLETMAKTYGTVVGRQYVPEAIEAGFFVAITPEENQQINQAEAAAGAKAEDKKEKPAKAN